MKNDKKLFIAVLILIGLIIWLLIISIQRSDQINKVTKEVETLQTAVNRPAPIIQQPLNGHTPVLGVDYFNGVPGVKGVIGNTGATGQTGRSGQSIIGPAGPISPAIPGTPGKSAYEIAVTNGFIGTEQQWIDSLKVKGDKGDPASELMIQCVKGLLSEKYQGDSFWQTTNIKCEITTP